jgi:antitoxin component YwqK of YwqJK toxin-antitoxin module
MKKRFYTLLIYTNTHRYAATTMILGAGLFYILSYGPIISLAEYCKIGKPIYYLFEGVEWLRWKSNTAWKLTELIYRYSGGKVESAKRYGFLTPRKVIGTDKYNRIYIHSFLNGYKHGEQVAWWPNGRLGYRSHYSTGIPDGPSKSWYYNGNIFMEGTFKNGLIIGDFVKYYDHGGVMTICKYNSYGEITFQADYDKHGDEIASGKFSNGRLHDGSFIISYTYIVFYDNGNFLKITDLEGNNVDPSAASIIIRNFDLAYPTSRRGAYPTPGGDEAIYRSNLSRSE